MNPRRRTKRAARKVQLRELSVQKAKPKDTAYLIWDAKQRGLALRVQPTGSKAWVCVYSRQGRPRWLTLGDAGTVGLADAREMAGEAMLAVIKGKDPAAEKKAERSKGTFEELAAAYVEQYAKIHNKSWKQAEALIRSHALPRLGKLQAASITRDDIKTMMQRIAAPVLANQVVAAVSAIFSWAIKEEKGFTTNPAKLITRNPTKDRERVLSESEVPMFWQVFSGIDDVVQGAALKAILLLGQRPGEVRHMRREHIKDGWWEMPGEPIETLGWPGTKSGESHRVWLPKPALQLIAGDDDKTTGFVFAASPGRPVRDLDDAMRKISTKLGVEAVKPHDLRRTHGTTITKLKFGRDAMDRVQNHKEGGVTDIYDRHTYEDENKNIMETVADHLMGLVEGRDDETGKVLPFRA
jgi:integrase